MMKALTKDKILDASGIVIMISYFLTLNYFMFLEHMTNLIYVPLVVSLINLGLHLFKKQFFILTALSVVNVYLVLKFAIMVFANVI